MALSNTRISISLVITSTNWVIVHVAYISAFTLYTISKFTGPEADGTKYEEANYKFQNFAFHSIFLKTSSLKIRESEVPMQQ